MYKLIPQSSLYKPFFDVEPTAVYSGQSMLRNETLSFQVVSVSPPERTDAVNAYITVESDLPTTVYEVIQHAVMRPTYAKTDDRYERTAPGVYPDALKKLPESGVVRLCKNVNTALWITVNADRETLSPGVYPVKVKQVIGNGEPTVAEVTVTVVDAMLPEQSLIYTNWFHCDCIADRYKLEIFSDEFFAMCEKYIASAVKGGMNMMLVPCFTPPLDTPVGGERMTAQLVGVTLERDGSYSFDFSLLERFLDICERCGVRYYEHSHLFTQWGAAHSPKVMANTPDGYRRIFGWETDATVENGEYANFLASYLPKLITLLEDKGIGDRMYFHISDEPTVEHLGTYRAALALVEPYTKGYHRFEALSSYEFYQTGLVETPVPTTVHADPFLGNVENLWLYYTGIQSNDSYSNRLIALPNVRNRALGIQMFASDIKGFLHWGFNFWYTTLSERQFDPWAAPDADRHFVGGTSYMVYPDADGPAPSIRYYSFAEGIDDIRALEAYAAKLGRDAAMALIFDSFGGAKELFDAKGHILQLIPTDDEMSSFRERLNSALAR